MIRLVATKQGAVKQHICNRWKVWSNGTNSVPKSVPRLVVDKVRFYVLQFLCSKYTAQKTQLYTTLLYKKIWLWLTMPMLSISTMNMSLFTFTVMAIAVRSFDYTGCSSGFTVTVTVRVWKWKTNRSFKPWGNHLKLVNLELLLKIKFTIIFLYFHLRNWYLGSYIVFVWSHYDGGNIDKEQLAEVPSKTQRSQAEYYGRSLIMDPNNKIMIQPFTI